MLKIMLSGEAGLYEAGRWDEAEKELHQAIEQPVSGGVAFQPRVDARGGRAVPRRVGGVREAFELGPGDAERRCWWG